MNKELTHGQQSKKCITVRTVNLHAIITTVVVIYSHGRLRVSCFICRDRGVLSPTNTVGDKAVKIPADKQPIPSVILKVSQNVRYGVGTQTVSARIMV